VGFAVKNIEIYKEKPYDDEVKDDPEGIGGGRGFHRGQLKRITLRSYR
jgi:hypothetical protein